ncbi:MAG: CPBP family intramembrane metalloprotease, partial [Acidobacteria bacterium]|nr:CPBP family intramembrane metalloprotease [Acidobacteriota bacterium]
AGWARDLSAGLLIGLLMIAFVVGLQVAGGGTRLVAANSNSWRGIVAASLLLWLAAAFEELVFRGYAFQTLLRDVPAWVPILILNLFFGMAHWTNPSRTTFSTINTALAGIWLALAVMRTRSLWLATGLHFSWNWTMGVLFGLPVSGMRLPDTLLFASSEAPLWLTGGSYGSEGGVTATLAFTLAAMWIWRTARLKVAKETELALTDQQTL